MNRKSYGLLFLAALLLSLALACLIAAPPSQPIASPSTAALPTAPPSATPWPTATPLPPDTGWQVLDSGVQVRSLNVPAGPNTERVTVVRVDPAQLRIRVFYQPGAGYPVSAWAQQTGALLVLNGGYFTPEKVVTGLTISNGERHGAAYGDYAGMLAVTYDEDVTVRWLREWPYDPDERLREAIQCFPVLVKPGGVMGFPADADDGRMSRRTMVGQDREGHLLLLIAPRGYLSLHQLADWLARSDLNLDTALNLDGGTSSGLWIAGGPQVDSMIPVPVVIAVLPP
jgi:uncharacterized protein YigE (DUF2233 family)